MQVNWNPPHQLSLLSRPRLALARCGTRPIVLRSSLPRSPPHTNHPRPSLARTRSPKKIPSNQTAPPLYSQLPAPQKFPPWTLKKIPLHLLNPQKKYPPHFTTPEPIPTIQTLKKFSIIPYQNYSQIRRLNPIIPRLKDSHNPTLNP